MRTFLLSFYKCRVKLLALHDTEIILEKRAVAVFRQGAARWAATRILNGGDNAHFKRFWWADSCWAKGMRKQEHYESDIGCLYILGLELLRLFLKALVWLDKSFRWGDKEPFARQRGQLQLHCLFLYHQNKWLEFIKLHNVLQGNCLVHDKDMAFLNKTEASTVWHVIGPPFPSLA